METLNNILDTLAGIDAFFFTNPAALGMAALSAFTTGMTLAYFRALGRGEV